MLLPESIGVIMPFRYCEIINSPDELDSFMIKQVAVHYHFNDQASSFSSSSVMLNDIWNLCRYSMKATSFCGVYVDGDRERIPYEADAYINQLSHYAVDREFTLARYSHEYLLKHPTWPTEWKQHSVLMAWTDYMYTGNLESLAANYSILREKKTLEQRAREDGLLNTKGLRDIVDWPTNERDGYQFKEVNTVINAFYCYNMRQMADIAGALGRKEDADMYRARAEKAEAALNSVLFNSQAGLYVDGEGTSHSSLHANMMPLAFELVPGERVSKVRDFLKSKGMACSVYGAQYLLEALYMAGADDHALQLMVSDDIRSWYNMLRVGSTVTLEAWDIKYKGNLDWNHAWGAAPGNIIPRYVMGVRPLGPGFEKMLVKPQPGSLKHAEAVIPTIRGAVRVAFENRPKKSFMLDLTVPGNTTAEVHVPAAKLGDVREGDGPAEKAEGVKFLRMQDGRAVFSVGSGSYSFRSGR